MISERRALESDLELARAEEDVTKQSIGLYRSLRGGWEQSIHTIEAELAAKGGPQ